VPEAAVRVAVWSDYVCPFCYLELPVLERLKREAGVPVRVEWRAFELRPDPVPTLDPDGAYLHRVWNQSVYPMARERGLTLRLPPVQPRSRKAHEATAFARTAGRADATAEALFRAFFEHGRDIGEPEVLVAAGREAGLDADALRRALDEGRFTAEVLADEAEAQRLGLSGVPALVVGPAEGPIEQGYLLQGAQPYETVAAVVDRVARGQHLDER
jgi:predicted DsbA family dithiol-disulfide isomerase